MQRAITSIKFFLPFDGEGFDQNFPSFWRGKRCWLCIETSPWQRGHRIAHLMSSSREIQLKQEKGTASKTK